MQENKTQMEFQEELLDFRPTLIISEYFHLDVYREKWVVPSDWTGKYKKEDIHNYTDIVDFELLEYEATLGGDLCTSMKIKITLNDSNNPFVFIEFIPNSVEKSSFLYRSYLEHAQKIMSILHLITSPNDTIDNKETSMSMLENKTQMEFQEELLDFRPTLIINKYFHLDLYRKKWVVPSSSIWSATYKKEDIHSYTDIGYFELLENEATIVKSNGNAIVRAATGGLLFGPVGFFFGALTTREKSYDVCSIKIKITLNDINNTVVFIEFIPGSVEKSSFLYRSYLEEAEAVMSILYLITDSNNTLDNKETSMSSVAAINDAIYTKETTMNSVADELKKFKELLDSGAINQTEFDELKSKLINNYK